MHCIDDGVCNDDGELMRFPNDDDGACNGALVMMMMYVRMMALML